MSSSESDFEKNKKNEIEEKQKKKRLNKRAREEETEEPQPKREKSVEAPFLKDEHGNEMFEFGNMRYASVSCFKGKQYLNIREYYTDKNSGKMMPSKKGISLTKVQWTALKDLIPCLDKKF